ncbi:TSUP family transporter, partial [Sandarakinorhabdus sp.]|uniref:TSUP family transporter n=1 Tax=Sandarakinorhabdus sp. TaxID=1916663 RepID=UPI003568A987
MIESLLAALGGAIIALLLGLFGGGGSVLATPWLLYAVGITDPHVAIGTGAAAVALNAGANLLLQARAGTVKWP